MKANRRKWLLYIVMSFSFLLHHSLTFTAATSTNEAKSPKYFKLQPDLVTNLKATEQPAFLQIQIEIMAKDDEAINKIKYHEPLIRDRLISLFASKTREQMEKVESRKVVRDEALKVVQTALEQVTGQPLTEEILFTQVDLDTI